MTTEEEALQSVATARQNTAQARTELEQRRQEVKVAEEQLQSFESKLPQNTQRNLRQRFANLEGRRQRQTIQKVRGDIESKKGEIEQYKTSLSDYEKDIQLSEQNIASYEAQMLSESYAYDTLRKNIEQDAQIGYSKASSINQIREAYQSANLNPDEGQSIYENYVVGEGKQSLYEDLNPDPKIYEKGDFLGTYNIESGKIKAAKGYDVKMSGGVIEYSKKELEGYQSILPKLDRNVKKDFPQSIPEFKVGGATGFATVSAQQYQTPIPQYQTLAQPSDLIRTTGSPIKFVPLIPSKIDVVRFDPLWDIKRVGQLGKEVGYFKAVPTFVGEQIKRGLTKAQIALGKPFGEPEPLPLPSGTQLETPASRISGLGGFGGATATYFTPVGIPLLVGGGVEEYVTPSGRTRLSLMGEAIEQKYKVPKELAYGLPALEIGLGLYGFKRTKFDVTRPVVREQPLVVDVKYPKGYGRTLGAEERIVTVDSLGRPVVVERGIPTTYFGDVGVQGIKRQVTTPFREFFGMKPIYSGTRAEQVGGGFIGRALELPTKYQKVYNLLKERGYTDYQARQALRQVRPQYKRTTGQGEMTIVQRGEEKPLRLFAGKQTTSYIEGEKGGVKYIKKKPEVLDVDETASYLGEGKSKIIDIIGITKKGKVKGKVEDVRFDVIGFERLETKPLGEGESLLPETLVKGAGKRTERFKGVVGAKYVKEVRPFALDIESPTGEIKFRITPEETFARYKTVDISKKIIPKERRLLTGEGIADISRAEPKITIYDESIKEARGFQGGGSKSSPQFLKELYQGTEQAKAETVLSLLKTKPVRGTPKVSKVSQELLGMGYPKMVGGQGIEVIDYTKLGLGTIGLNIIEDSTNYGKSGLVFGVFRRDSRGISDSSFFRDFSGSRSSRRGEIMGEDTQQVSAETTFDLSRETTRQDNQLRIGQGEVSLVTSKEVLGLRQPQREVLIERIGQKEIQVQQPALKLFERLKQEQVTKQVQKTQQITRQQEIQRPREPRTPRVPRIRLFKEKPKERTAKETLEDIYEVFVRKKGQDISIGEFEGLGKAKTELFGELRKSLRAGGYVTKGGEKVKLELFGTEFRPSKRDSFRAIQPKTKRLSAKSEVSEIQFLKGKRKKSMWGF